MGRKASQVIEEKPLKLAEESTLRPTKQDLAVIWHPTVVLYKEREPHVFAVRVFWSVFLSTALLFVN